jgi:transposase
MRLDLPAPVVAYLQQHPTAPPAQMATALGLAHSTARAYRHRALRLGMVVALRKRISVEDARELLEDGLHTRDVAKRLGISRNALACRLCRADTPISVVRTESVFSATDIARILGVSKPTARWWLRHWRAQGLIRCRVGQRTGSPWRIAVTDWMAFLERRDCPLQPEQIADPDWRAYAADWRERRPH